MAAVERPSLSVEGVSVRFGGHLAVDDVSLHAPSGEITGLIGPNGAGKTTLFNACTGVVSATGSVRLGTLPMAGMSTTQRAASGLGRTFQRIELFDSMTVRENVGMGREAQLAGQGVRRHLRATAADRRDIRARTDEALARCGVIELADHQSSTLSTGARRRVELARAVAAGFTFLLLDEPSSGLDAAESESFAAVLAAIVAKDHIGVLLVEHDMSLIRSVCVSTYVLEFGRLICDGATDEVLASEIVRRAYLGVTA